MPRLSPDAVGGANVCAFLDMIAVSEIGDRLLKASDDGYNVLVGSTSARPLLFDDYSRHPNVLNKTLNSTAAGRYQILYRWWVPYQKRLVLPDFGPESQDRYALEQLREQGALGLIQAGRISEAIGKLGDIWASFPSSTYNQPRNKMPRLLFVYESAGGVLA